MEMKINWSELPERQLKGILDFIIQYTIRKGEKSIREIPTIPPIAS
jgi:hypothetical protein